MELLPFTPIQTVLGTDFEEIPGTTVPVGEEWSIDVRASNVGDAPHMVRLGISPDEDPPTVLSVPDYEISAKDARDLEEKLTLPAGWRLFARASDVDVIHLRITGRRVSVA